MVNKDELDNLPNNPLDESNYLQYVVYDIDDKGKHGPLTNIFSCWNSMVGTGLVTIPWAYAHTGIILGVILTFISFSTSFTTQYFVMKTAGKDSDYTETLKKTFGKRGWYIGMILFIFMLFIPIIIYFGLMAQFLYPVLLAIIEAGNGKDRDITDRSINFK